MYLKELKLKNYRKFGSETEIASFVTPNKIGHDSTIEEKVSSSTSLIVGRNNSGKTTITKALEEIVKGNSELKHSDFNLNYLDEVFKDGIAPFLEFELTIELDREDAYIHRLLPLMSLDEKVKDLKIIIKYMVDEAEIFKNKIFEIKSTDSEINSKSRKKLYKLIDKTKFRKKIFNSSEKEVKDLKLYELINLKTINADKEIGGENLSGAFNKIFHSKFIKDIIGKKNLDNLEDELEKVGESLEKKLKKHYGPHEEKISKLLQDRSDTTFRLSCDLNHDSLLNNVINYEYQDGEYRIPEDQFGLGYTNLMLIVAQIIEYIEREYNSENKDGINIICIEEPEAFMHPEMQRLFMQNIAKTVEEILEGKGLEKVNFQLIITTHSPFILESKIKLSNSFDNINYMNHNGNIIILKDENVVSETLGEKKERLKLEKDLEKNISEDKKESIKDSLIKLERNIKLKYIAVKVTSEYSEIFFSDAIIAVEGDSEKSLLPRFLEKNKKLRNKNISILNTGGAHTHMFFKLFENLGIPTVVVTDLDIIRGTERIEIIKNGEKKKKNIKKENQITNVGEFQTTNNSLKDFFETSELSEIIEKNMKISENILVATQHEAIENHYATSLEESIILTNHTNEKFLEILRKIRPQVASGDVVSKSFKIQKSLGNDSGKTELASQLNYELITNKEFMNSFVTPEYIECGINYLAIQLKGDRR